MSCDIFERLKAALLRSQEIATEYNTTGKSWVKDDCICGRKFGTYVSVEPHDGRTLEERVKDLEDSVKMLAKEFHGCKADQNRTQMLHDKCVWAKMKGYGLNEGDLK